MTKSNNFCVKNVQEETKSLICQATREAGKLKGVWVDKVLHAAARAAVERGASEEDIQAALEAIPARKKMTFTPDV